MEKGGLKLKDLRDKVDFLKNENIITDQQAISLRSNIMTNRLSAAIVLHMIFNIFKIILDLKKEIDLLKKEKKVVKKGA